MAYDSTNKKLYRDTSSGYPGISTSEIATCLEDYRVTARGRDIGLLCTSPKINKWAKCKPVRYSTFSPLTDEQRQDVDYGIDVSSAHDTTYAGVIAKAIDNNCEYGYLQPRGLPYGEPFRTLDFDGYNHKAKAPYGYTLSHLKGDADGWVDVYIADGADLTLADLDPSVLATSDIMACNIVILLRKEGETTGGYISFAMNDDGDYITLADIKDTSYAAPVLRFTIPSGGIWNLAIAITSATEDSLEDELYMYLPNSLFSFEYDPDYVGFKWFFPEDNAVQAQTSAGTAILDTSVEVDKLRVQMAVEVDTDFKDMAGAITIEVGSSLTDFENNSVSETETFELAPGESIIIDKTFSNLGSLIASSSGLYISNLYVRAKMAYTVGETTNTVYFDFLETNDVKGAQKKEYQQPVSAQEIYNTWEW